MQRIHYFATEQDRDALFAAMCDLFIVLGDNGEPLRARLFEQYRRCLQPRQAECLQAFTGSRGLRDDLAFLPGECLFRKSSVEPVCLSAPALRTVAEDPLSVADSYIENSQFDMAVDYMRSQLEKNSASEAMTMKLIELYRATGNTAALARDAEKFSKNKTLSPLWQAAIERLKNLSMSAGDSS
ncbi:MAG TPA: hypothetical protein ENJ64_02990 [Thiotrichales bacterium]|nr:hypothetical protein [Thiotrichales bacterium]